MKKSLTIFLMILALACKKDEEPVPAPTKATLTFPAENAACTSGTVVTDSTASITFTWNASENTDKYELSYRNLITRVLTSQIVTTNQAAVTLSRNTPYSWYVRSIGDHSTDTAQSDTWKFYMSGPGTISYSPFPAAITLPVFNQSLPFSTGKVKLAWTGSDVDNDITGYDVYFGTTTTPPLLQANVTTMFINGVTITPATTFYWKVITHDAEGNTSDSGLYSFIVI
ncbi:hypothetical protein [Chitinophaga tropicalis]|uniref:Fibronectin type-III domain-containing protein n=1 Tax=Chitinophaga tropicalis TaxID=2683588 RepID=A0A7K1U669_9BACT|nr:hypothetical protein [Chitinophaga tropicalis]MVT09840.1 hypothetical protein [Chitinophaga tropicalis]